MLLGGGLPGNMLLGGGHNRSQTQVEHISSSKLKACHHDMLLRP